MLARGSRLTKERELCCGGLGGSGGRSFRAAKADGCRALIQRRAATGCRSEHDLVTLPRTAADALVASACRARWIALRHVGVVVEAEPVLHPFGDVSRHMVEAIGALAGVMRIHWCENGDLMDVVLAEHGE